MFNYDSIAIPRMPRPLGESIFRLTFNGFKELWVLSIPLVILLISLRDFVYSLVGLNFGLFIYSLLFFSLFFVSLGAIVLLSAVPFKPRKSSSRVLSLNDAKLREFALAYNRIAVLANSNESALQALSPAHQALVEVASLLEGRKIEHPSETKYVTRRLNTLNQIGDKIEANIAKQIDLEIQEAKALRAASIKALERFDSRTNLSSLSRLDEVAASLSKNLS